MNPDQIHREIEKIAQTSSRLEKQDILRKLAADPAGAKIIKFAYDPYLTYGVKPNFSINEEGTRDLSDDHFTNLLIPLAERKYTGNLAKRAVFDAMSELKPNSARLLYWILSKDLKCGIAESTINVAVPGLVPSFSVARAQTYEERFVKNWPWKAEPKLDGQRNTLLVKHGKGAFFTRSGHVVPALQFLVKPVLDVAHEAIYRNPELCEVMTGLRSFMGGELQKQDVSFMLDGEAMMGLFKDTGKLRGNADAEGAELHLYDMMPFDMFDKPDSSVAADLETRRHWLNLFVDVAYDVFGKHGPIQKVPQYFVNSHDEAHAMFEQMLNTPLARYLARGDAEREAELAKNLVDKETGGPKMLEGLMIKDPKAFYEKRKSRSWLKLKADDTEDLIVIGAFPGKPGTKYENSLGGLIVDRKGVEVRVAGGFSDELRDQIWKIFNREVAAMAIHPDGSSGFEHRPGTKGIVWNGRVDAIPSLTILGVPIEVKFHEPTPDGSLRHPRFVRVRDDKEKQTAA